MRKPKKRIRPPKRPDKMYYDLWKVIDGSVKNAFDMHPDYLTQKGMRFETARMSIVKRVTGAVWSFQAARARAVRRSRSGGLAQRPKGSSS